MDEHWKAVVGYEGIYEVSDFGNVRRVGPRSNGRKQALKQMTPHKSGAGYLMVGLRRNGRKPEYVHRLVMAAFVGPCPSSHEVNHKNGNKRDNSLTNLEYLSHRANRLYSFRVLDKHGWKLSPDDVIAIRHLHKQGVGVNELAKKFAISVAHSSSICLHKKWKNLA